MKKVNKMTMTGLVLRHVALRVQSMLLGARQEAIRKELIRRLDGPEQQTVAGYAVRKIWNRSTSYMVRRASGWRLEVKRG